MLDAARQEHRAVRFWYRPSGGTFSFVTWVVVLDRAQCWALDDDKQQRLKYTFLVAAVPDPHPSAWPTSVNNRLNDGPIADTPPPSPPSSGVGEFNRARSYRDYINGLGEDPDATQRPPTRRPRNNYQRSRQARDAVLVRAGDRCENDRCTGMPADITPAGTAILEVDHVDDLALGGNDHPRHMIALCPNCHATKTRGKHRAALRRHLHSLAAALHDTALNSAD